jgi:hypothetical protein
MKQYEMQTSLEVLVSAELNLGWNWECARQIKFCGLASLPQPLSSKKRGTAHDLPNQLLKVMKTVVLTLD